MIINRRTLLRLPAAALADPAALKRGATPPANDGVAQSSRAAADDWFSNVRASRSLTRAARAMVATSQPLASEAGLAVLKRGGNAVDAAIAMAAVLNVTEPHMTGIGGDVFAMIYWAKTRTLEGLNASGRAPRALSLDHFRARQITSMPTSGMEPVTVPGAF